MSESTSANEAGAAGREEMISAMFAGLVMQHTNMALIFLGLAPNPQTGKKGQDLDHARYFIDQLEMLEVKTKGNLTKEEEGILKQSLAAVRMAFVEAVNHPQAAPAPAETDAPKGPDTDEEESPVNDPVLPGEKPPAEESRKIFTKKYT